MNTGCSLVLSALSGEEWNCKAKSSPSSNDEETVVFGAAVGSWEGLKACPDASSFASSSMANMDGTKSSVIPIDIRHLVQTPSTYFLHKDKPIHSDVRWVPALPFPQPEPKM